MSAPLDLLREAVRAGRADVRLLVPTATLAEHRRHQLAREGLVLRPELVQTFSRFVADLAPETKQVSEPLFQLVVERALREVEPREFEPVSDAPGFAASVAGAIRRLDAVGLSARELGSLCAAWPYSGPLARVWARVEEKLRNRGLALRAGVLRAAARVARPGGTLLLDGFAKFSAPERGVLLACGIDEEEGVDELPAMGQCYTAASERFFADSEVREAEEVARRILEAHASGTPFREMGVTLRNPERYVAVLRPILERFGIPARFYFSEPLADNAAVRFFAGSVDAFLAGWDHERVLPVLRLASGFGAEVLDGFDFLVRERIPNAGLASLLEMNPPAPVRRLISDWETLHRNWQRRIAPKRWAELLAADFRNTYKPEAIPDRQAESTVKWERARAAAVSLFESALLEAASDWPDDVGAVTLAEFWERAKTVVRHTALRVADRRRDVVHVMSVYEARQWELDIVFLCGLAEKAFPKRHQEDAFLPDAAMEKLQDAGFGVETSGDLNKEEERLFERVRRSARKAVVLSYAVEQKNGPSPFWGEPEETLDAPATVRPAVMGQHGARGPISRVADPALLEWIARERSNFSVTGLEYYLGCQYKFFELNLLKCKPAPARPSERLNNLEQGTLVHKVLEQWLKEGGAIRPVFERVFAEQCAALRVTRGFRTEAAYAVMLDNLERFASGATIWPRLEAVSAEQDMELQVSEQITVRARVDRIERLPDGRLVIIDFKYSNAKNTQDRTEDETRLQGPLYVKGIAKGGAVVAAMVYFSLKRSAEPFGWGEVPGLQKELQALTPEWVENGVAQARSAVDSIREGNFAVRARVGPPCQWCDAKHACRVEMHDTDMD